MIGILLVVFCVLCLLCTACVHAEKMGDYEYIVLEDGTTEITKYVGSSNELTIPAALGGVPVKSIGKEAFYFCDQNFSFCCLVLTSVTFPDSITTIGNSAFRSCVGLTNITFPDSITAIGDQAFYNCSGLTSITLPDSLTSIGD